MKTPSETIINKVTLSVIHGVFDEIGKFKCNRFHKNGIDMLAIDYGEASYKVAIDNDILSFMMEVSAPVSGYINVANEWNMFETTGTAICLTSGYGLKHGVFVRGGIVRETLIDFVNSFGEHSLKFIEKVKKSHQ